MKKLILAAVIAAAAFASCNSSRSMATIEPKSGNIELPAKGELRIWKNTQHPSFRVMLTNNAPQQSCEVYTVQSSGVEKWVSPSLVANSTLTVTVPADGHLFFKNFNPNTLTILYKVEL